MRHERNTTGTALSTFVQCASVCAVLLSFSSSAEAEHPIDVQRFAAKSQFFEALVTYERLPRRVSTTETTLSAAKSAWALGLSERAIEEYERALRDENLSPAERARIYLSRGIIEYQEGRYQVGTLFAERAKELLPDASELRGKVWLLWAESLYRLRSYGAAEAKYLSALNEVGAVDKAEVHYLLGRCRVKLGKEEQAREDFQLVPLDHERTAESMRALAQLALETDNFDHVAFWLTTGRREFPDSFLDSWVDYALVQVAIHQGDRTKVRQLRENALKKYAPSDYWLTLLDAAAEGYEWRGRTRSIQEKK